LQAYEDSVREVVANGFVTREEVQLLEHLRNQFEDQGIGSRKDHDLFS